MTPIAKLVADRIADKGPIPLSEFMAFCMTHPEHGYYVTRDPFGATGDFVTAPEISQMFGELLGLCLAQAWIAQGRPSAFALTELGPGRGTLMADVLRATRTIAGFHQSAQVHFVEASPVLRRAQSQAVPSATFHEAVESLPDLPLYLIANEFFDALPIRQYQRIEDGWAERLVTVQSAGSENEIDLSYQLSDRLRLPDLERRADVAVGQIVELAPALPQITQAIASRLDRQGGVALIIDYGDWTSLGDTLQALRHHQAAHPLSDPGEVDLTAHVDFAAIAAAAQPAKFTRLTPQGVFLERLGITDRARALAAGLSGARLDSHIAAHRRLTHPAEMGDLFKVIGLYPASAEPPPGLLP